MTTRDDLHTILIVDDTHENIRILMETLKGEYKLQAATSGERALEMLFEGKTLPDLILMDIIMPGIDGYEVCRQLKENDTTRHIPVIFVTAISEVMDETRGFKLGAVDYITKPFHPPIVKARVQAHINLKVKTDMLEKLASLDGLTNIPNRRKFDEVIENEWKRALRYDFPLSVIMIDVDQFKQFNDHYGHAMGDTCLQSIARALSQCLKRPYDFIARYGGEEFVVILPDVNLEGAEQLARGMQSAVFDLEIPHTVSTVTNTVTVSLGVATIHPKERGGACLEVVDAADKQLYKAKAAGRNHVSAIDLG